MISIARLVAVPAFIYAMMNGAQLWAFSLFLLAGISDGVDGYIARAYNQRSELGAWLDPIADKSLMVAGFVLMGWFGHLPDWLIILVVFRDALIVGAVILSSLIGKPMAVAPIYISKATTVFQITLITIVLAELAFNFATPYVVNTLVILTGLLTIASALSYLVVWLRHLNGKSGSQNQYLRD